MLWSNRYSFSNKFKCVFALLRVVENFRFQLKDPAEKQTFFTNLPEKVDQFPWHINEKKLLPLLFNAYEFGSAGSAVLPTLFKLGKKLSDADYKKRIVPLITKFFASTDRMTRFRLLQQVRSNDRNVVFVLRWKVSLQLDTYVEHLTAAVVNDDIFPHICTGFTDQEPAIREATVKVDKRGGWLIMLRIWFRRCCT